MIVLMDEHGKRFRTTTDEWWVIANWNKDRVLAFNDRVELNRYCTKHGLLLYRAVEVDHVLAAPKGDLLSKRAIEVTYDLSNSSYYIYVAQLHYWTAGVHRTEMDAVAYRTLGAAQVAFKHMGGDWYVENHTWTLDLKGQEAYKVTIHELLLMK